MPTLHTNREDESHGCIFQSRNVRLNGRRTSIRLELAMWEALEEIASREAHSMSELCTLIAAKKNGSNLTASVRLFITVYFRIAAHSGKLHAQNGHSNAFTPSQKDNSYSPLMSSALAVLA